MARKQETTEQIDQSLKRWKTRLKRAMTAIDKLEKKRKRLASRTAIERKPVKPEPLAVTILKEIAAPPAPAPAPRDDLAIPAFLKRGPAPGEVGYRSPADLAAAAAIEAEQAERKRRRSRARIEKMKAKQSGKSAEMPLSGKAALAKINAG